MPAMMMLHDVDPKQVVLDKLGDISDVEVFNNEILVAVYIPPEKTRGGILITDSVRDENKSQGKVGLVVKMGAMACQTAINAPENDLDLVEWDRPHDFKLMDWVVFRASDGWAVTVNKYLCRMVRDDDIRMRVQHPDQVW